MLKKIARRESKSAVAYISVSVVLILGLAVFGASVFFKVLVIEAVGASRYLREDIVKVSGIMIGDSILFMDTNAASQRILAAMPYISEVKIETSFPDRVRIIVTETTAAATIDYLDSVVLIDSAGRVLDHLEHAPQGLIEVRGFTPSEASLGSTVRTGIGDDTKLRYLIETLEAMEIGGIQKNVSYIDVTNIAHVTFQYFDRFTVILGTTDNISHKLESLPEIIAEIEANPDRSIEWRITLSGQMRADPIR